MTGVQTCALPICEKSQEGLSVTNNEKGRTIITSRRFEKGEYLCVYGGENISFSEYKRRRIIYAEQGLGNYLFEFKTSNGKKAYSDATPETNNFGRLINHSRKEANCTACLSKIENNYYIYFKSNKVIDCGQELLYDYGDRDAKTLNEFRWLKE